MSENRKFLTVIVGPTCSGKTTLQDMLFGNGFVKVVTTTTRAPRLGEDDGIDYNFVTKEAFESLVENGDLLEHEEFCGNYYGVSKSALDAAFEKSAFCTVVVGAKGLRSILRHAPLDVNVKVIVIHVPMPVLVERLRKRGVSEDELAVRTRGLQTEHASFVYRPQYGKRVISPTSLVQLSTFANHYDPRNGHIENPIQVEKRPGRSVRVS